MDVTTVLIGLVALAAVLGLRRFQLRGASDLEVDRTRFVPVADVGAVRDLLTAPGPGVLFLHDPGCPISAGAHREMARLGGEIPLVNVQRSRDVSRAVEATTGIRHESPQVFVLSDGRVTWSGSHTAITASAVREAIAESAMDRNDRDGIRTEPTEQAE